jgi:hypothetical protein
VLPVGLPTYRGSRFAWHAAREYAEYHLRVVLDADLDRTALARLVDRNLFFQRLPRPAEPNTQAHKQTPDLGRARQPGFPSADALTRRCHFQWPIPCAAARLACCRRVDRRHSESTTDSAAFGAGHPNRSLRLSALQSRYSVALCTMHPASHRAHFSGHAALHAVEHCAALRCSGTQVQYCLA